MKNLKDISIKVKFPMMIGTASFIVLAIVSTCLSVFMRSSTLKKSTELARQSALSASQYLMEEVNTAASVARTFSVVVGEIAKNDIIPQDKKREMVLDELETIVEKDSLLTNLWCFIEPNALDSLDSQFIDRLRSNSNGNFTAWFIDGQWSVPIDPYSSDYYIQTKKNRSETLSEPYFDTVGGKKVNMFSFCVPVIVDGRFIGVVGSDFGIENLNRIMQRDLNQNIKGTLISANGNITVSSDLKLIGKKVENGNPAIYDKLLEKKAFEGFFDTDTGSNFKLFNPVSFGQDSSTWFYAVDMPASAIYADAKNITTLMVFSNLISILLIMIIVWRLSLKIVNKVVTVTDVIHHMSTGRLDMNVDKNQGNDELGQMNKELETMIEGLQRTSSFAGNIGNGEFDTVFQPLSDEDVLGNALLEMRDNLHKADNERNRNKREEEKRNWAANGLAKFAGVLQQDNDNLDTLSYNIISNLVKYLGANQGGIFILNEEDGDKFLELKACYAYNRKKFLQKQIQPGEGLVGTCYLEGEPTFMTDIPDSYVTITSGLGEANPRSLLISPLKTNGEVYGVLEIASFEPLEEYQLTFVEHISESIASTISSVWVNIRTNRLLSQTQLQAEEMANQEEELRQNMEEMQATQEEMRRREKELSDILVKMEEMHDVSNEKEYEMQQFYHAVFESFNVIEFSTEANIIDINQNVINTFDNVDKSFFVGKPLADIIGEESKKLAWTYVMQGKSFENIQPIATGPDKTTIFKQKFLPILSSKGELKRVLLLAYPERIS